jgi:hypothetical protein
VVAGAVGVVAGANVTDVAVTCFDESLVQGNDGWEPGQNLNFQAGFVAGETAAVRVTPGGTGLRTVRRVLFLFGGAPTTQTVRLHIWRDTSGTAAPDSELYAADYQITGANALQQIDLSGQNIQVSDTYRVGIEFNHSGLPSVSRDNDGIIADRNFIDAEGLGWVESSVLGLTGDWTIRTMDEAAAADEFAITAIEDLPNDQGRQVRIAWDAAGQDAPGGSPLVTGYAIFRRIDAAKRAIGPDGGHVSAAGTVDPGAGLLADGIAPAAYPPGDWDYLTTVPAFQEASYATVVPTVADSTIDNGMYWSVFFVRATTASPGAFFDSAPDSGYSVDNLEPQAPQGLLVAHGGSGNELSWAPCPDEDFRFFKIYRGEAPDFVPEPNAVVHTTVASSWIDPNGGSTSYYRISAVDFSGNESALSAAAAVTGVGDIPDRSVALEQNVPNPFNPTTSISFTLLRDANVRLDIFDNRGRLVRELVSGPRPAGRQTAIWDGRGDDGLPAGSGVYFYRLEVAGELSGTRRMVLIR